MTFEVSTSRQWLKIIGLFDAGNTVLKSLRSQFLDVPVPEKRPHWTLSYPWTLAVRLYGHISNRNPGGQIPGIGWLENFPGARYPLSQLQPFLVARCTWGVGLVVWKKVSQLKNMGVSENSGTPKSSILIVFSIINHPFWGTSIFGNIHIVFWCIHLQISQVTPDPIPRFRFLGLRRFFASNEQLLQCGFWSDSIDSSG